MSIRPVDFNSMLPKMQELSKVKQVESDRAKIQSQQLFVQQDIKTHRDLSRVNDIKKDQDVKLNIKDNKKENSGGRKNNSKDNNKKKREEENKNNKLNVGNNIDIKI